ncbi:MAG: hypothetical protein KKA84_07480 [Bacteroidetes bacterium]|nr:hypothetical protein [Bacteroidota bacterium]
MIKKKGNSVALLSLCVLFPLLIFILPVTIPNNLSTYMQVNPYQKWVLEKGNENELISTVINYNSISENSYKAIKFERGEQISLEYSKKLRGKNSINTNDTVIVITSSEIDNILNTLQNQSNILEAELTCGLSGEKEPLVDEAGREYEYAFTKMKESETKLERSRQLFDKGYIAEEEFETAEWECKLNNIEVEKYSAKLKAVKSGSKQSEIELLRAEINSVVSQIEKYSELKKQLTILSPISGNLISGTGRDTILTVIDVNSMVLSVPVEFSSLAHFVKGKTIQINLTDFDVTVNGLIISKSSEVTFLEGRQIVSVNVLIDNPGMLLLPGLIVQGEILLNDTTVKDYLLNKI